ncbi:MAG: hypothetical protein IJQ80_04140, partial [Clostridia bacterium]|nr:hypothetical protein [Clostridia bacterium]
IDQPTRDYETPLFGGQRSSSFLLEIVDLSAKENWKGAIKGLRIDYFADTAVGDVQYLDSIIFCRSSSLAGGAGNDRLRERNGNVDNGTAGIWNTYWNYYKNANSYEFISGDADNLTMYFRYGSKAKMTARSIADRMARAITNATGYEVTCELYSYSFCDLDWSDSEPQAYMYYILRHDDEAYLATVKTKIIKDSGYSDALDGTSSDPTLTYQNTSTWASSGYAITNSKATTTFNGYIAYHSNHEIKLVETPYGTFMVHHTVGEDGNYNYEGGGQSSVFRIYDDGTSKKIYTYDCTSHTTKPQIMYGDDGLVYFVQADDSEGTTTAHISLGYFDPSQPKSDGTYNITYNRYTMAYPGGADPSGGGYGYSVPVLDPVSGCIYIFYCGGRDDPGFYLTWFRYNYRQHKWKDGDNAVFYDDYRHCYLYGYPDGEGGVYIVAERACLNECLGIQNEVYGADYTWDQINMFHVKNNGNATSQIVIPADYTQRARHMYPGCNNAKSDVFMTSDKKLHVLWTCGMHAQYIHTGISNYIQHCIYDASVAGAEPQLIYSEPICFASPDNYYSMRMVENTSGHLFIIAMPGDKDARCEVWRATDALGTKFELKACRNFSTKTKLATAMLAGNNRNNSIVDNTVSCAYPLESGEKYMFFTVTLPAD